MTRNTLVVSSAESRTDVAKTLEVCQKLEALGMNCLFAQEDIDRLSAASEQQLDSKKLFSTQPLEVVLVLGGDGSILRAAELVREQDAPLLGINLGHIGFMAEAEMEL
jgi:NAD+ kinase